MKVEMFPMAQNIIMLRIENIADPLNLSSSIKSTIKNVNLNQLAKDLFYLVNKDDIKVNVKIEELSLTGN